MIERLVEQVDKNKKNKKIKMLSIFHDSRFLFLVPGSL